MLTVVNFAATQFIAAKFQYQPALGEPLIRTKNGGGIYQPFAWIIWGWHNSTSPRCKSPEAVVSRRNDGVRRQRRVRGYFLRCGESEVPQAHGECRRSSRFGTLGNGERYSWHWSDGRATRRVRRSLVRWEIAAAALSRHNGPEHILHLPQRGLARALASSFPRCWPGPNRRSSTTSKVRTGPRLRVSVRNRDTSVLNSLRSNRRAVQGSILFRGPLFTPRDVSDAQNIANMIVRTGEDSLQERYWQDAAASITTGMILHVCYAAARERRVASLADLAHVFTTPGSNFRDTLAELLYAEHDPNGGRGWRLPTGERTITHPVVKRRSRKCSTRKTAISEECSVPRKRH